MLRELQKKLEEFHMVAPGDRVLVGVSGGADSLCLLLMLSELRKEMDFSVEVIHVEHGIRGEESVRDAKFVEEFCKTIGVSYQIQSVDVPVYAAEEGLGLEEAARSLRYKVFETLALEKGAKVALAHHQEDNAETVLFQMARGSSLAGLCGMQPVREDENGVCYIRPLLFFHREEIENFLKAYDLDWRVDSTNTDLEYSRNFIRAQVIPDLMKINAQAVEHVNQSAAHLSEIKDFLDVETEKLWSQIAKEEDKITLNIEALAKLHVVMQRQLVYKAIVVAAKRKKDITSTHVEDVLDLCRGQSGRRVSLPYGLVAWKEFDQLHVSTQGTQKEDADKEIYEVSSEKIRELLEQNQSAYVYIEETGKRLFCRVIKAESETLEIPRKTYTKWFDYDKIKQGFCIRTRRSGDYFISDANGHHKKLKQYFIDEKIPASERDNMWLLAKGDQVLWLIGGRISEDVKVSKETKYILELTYDGGNEDE